MDKRTLMFSAAAIALMAVVVANPAFAASAETAGAKGLTTIVDTITGNIGTMIGLAITIMGLWVWIVGQKTGPGVTMIIGGVLITLAPGIFNGARQMAGGVVTTFAGNGGVDDVKKDFTAE